MKIKIKHPRYVCTICGFTYDSYREVLQKRQSKEVDFKHLPKEWKCVQCNGEKTNFKEI